ncbi:polynucleotide adenylyltransferase PcnB [Simkania negevensis]|uniref:Polynucleotide adenylyltransferase PcnB n=1 Tax=Simkania negevensis TaxID=83561 RepID=A0ABS3ATK0_9BACT|nr:polynucleotide adenylyltransferase PcnB [Simkania negevensis]
MTTMSTTQTTRPAMREELKYFFCLFVTLLPLTWSAGYVKLIRLAHVRFGRKIIEVATFRSGDINESDLIIHDNCWGTVEEDAVRRDFTINALFYDPSEGTIIDYVGGVEDVKRRLLVTIGDPVMRFKQDPVRMIRLLKFCARFTLRVKKETMASLEECREEILKSAPARVLEEMFKMLESGAGAPFFRYMTEAGLLELIFPVLAEHLKGECNKEIYAYLNLADTLILHRSPDSLPRSVLVSSILFPLLVRAIEPLLQKGKTSLHLGKINDLIDHLIHTVFVDAFAHFPRKMRSSMNFVLNAQYRMTPLQDPSKLKSTNKRFRRIMDNEEFPMALALLEMRSMIDPSTRANFIDWQRAYYSYIEEIGGVPRKRERRPRRRFSQAK